eukprot:6134-Prymnesium_polylepis.1
MNRRASLLSEGDGWRGCKWYRALHTSPMHVMSVAGSAEHGLTPDSGWGGVVRGSEVGDAVSIRLGDGRVRPGLPLLRGFRVLRLRTERAGKDAPPTPAAAAHALRASVVNAPQPLSSSRNARAAADRGVRSNDDRRTPKTRKHLN